MSHDVVLGVPCLELTVLYSRETAIADLGFVGQSIDLKIARIKSADGRVVDR